MANLLMMIVKKTKIPRGILCRVLSMEPSKMPMPVVKTDKTNKAMKAYLERAKAHDDFMQIQSHGFRIGKRHLANMMGEDPETFNQNDIDKAIEYLFPSGLYDNAAKPKMKPPSEVFPRKKAAEFDETGRPNHSFFYTGKPNFFKLLFDVVDQLKIINEFEDRMIKKRVKADVSKKIELSGTEWISKDQLQVLLVEEIGDLEYENFVNAITRLAKHPYAHKCKDFIDKYRKSLMSQTNTYNIPELSYDSDGRSYVTVYECLRKRARADVTLRSPGCGKILINGQDITYFQHTQNREQLLFPLIFANMIGKLDIEANVMYGGPSGQAGAIRWGIAMGLRSFVDPKVIENMRLAGLLTRDYRRRERKKPGQEGARRKFTWKKR